SLAYGAIKVLKTEAGTGTPLSGARFTFTYGPVNVAADSGEDGIACAEGLPFGPYSVAEVNPPPGYVADDRGPRMVEVDSIGTCADAKVAETFTDTPIPRLTPTPTPTAMRVATLR